MLMIQFSCSSSSSSRRRRRRRRSVDTIQIRQSMKPPRSPQKIAIISPFREWNFQIRREALYNLMQMIQLS